MADADTPGFEIVGREDFSPATYSLIIRHPLMARAARPGQFVIAMSHESGERIPLTIADFDREKGTITLVVQAVGKTTKEMQQTCQVGTTLYALVGPMGIPSPLGTAKKVVCVGGGLGVAPIFPQARGLKENGAYVIGVLGFRSKNLVFWQDHPDIDEVIAIGPPLMMKACAEVTRPHAIKTMVSLNPIMVDGTGMCGGCRVKLGDQVKFACVDGPDFDAHRVDFADLMMRLRRYAEQEKRAVRRWSENCRMKDQIESEGALAPAEHPLFDTDTYSELIDLFDPFEQV